MSVLEDIITRAVIEALEVSRQYEGDEITPDEYFEKIKQIPGKYTIKYFEYEQKFIAEVL